MSRPRNLPFALTDQIIDRIAEGFRRAGFTEAGLCATLEVRSIPALTALPAEMALRRTAGGTVLHSLIRLFVIGVAEPAVRIGSLFAEPVEALAAAGLVEQRAGGWFAAVKVTPIDDLLIAFDRAWPDETVEPPDHVMGPSDSAALLGRVMLRRPVAAALDVGTGCGYLAFLLARYAERVIATDLNPRAAGFVRFNARLNRIGNVEARTGDRFAPVDGEVFDLVLSNPPFVISPEDRLVYLNGGMPADAFCRRMATGVSAFLKDGGVFQMLCNWVERTEVDWQTGLRPWFQGSGCDTWVLRSSTTDAVAYAKAWMRIGHHASDPDQSGRLDAWLAYYRQERITAIGGGVVTMRKRAGDDHWMRGIDGPADLSGSCGAAVLERMQALDHLARRAADPAGLWATVFRVSEAVRLTQECRPTDRGWSLEKATIRISEGLAYVEEIDLWLATLLAACDGRRPLRAACDHAAAVLALPVEDVPEETADIVRQLVDEGFLVPLIDG